MTRLTDREIDEIARRIAADIARGAAPSPGAGSPAGGPAATGQELGVFSSVGDAINAATGAQKQFAALKLAHRGRILEAMRQTMRENESVLAKAAQEETGLGRSEDKVVKNRLVTDRTPGLEDLTPTATTGDYGLTLVEPAPFGVIGRGRPSALTGPD